MLNFLHFLLQSLLETHDSVAAQACDSPPPSPCDFVDHEEDGDDDEDDNEGPTNNRYPPPDAIRMVGIRKVAGEHLVGNITDQIPVETLSDPMSALKAFHNLSPVLDPLHQIKSICVSGSDVQSGGGRADYSSYPSWRNDRPAGTAARWRRHQRGSLLLRCMVVGVALSPELLIVS